METTNSLRILSPLLHHMDYLVVRVRQKKKWSIESVVIHDYSVFLTLYSNTKKSYAVQYGMTFLTDIYLRLNKIRE